MKKSVLLLLLILILGAVHLSAEAAVYLDPGYSTDGSDMRLTLENLTDAKFPKPRNPLPVLFVPGDRSVGSGKPFQNDWQQSFNGLPSFRETLELAENSGLGIEPYFLDLEDDNPAIEEDAGKIKEAVRLILLHQGDPGAGGKKVVIIAYGKGAISARYYLKALWEEQNRKLAFHPVSELISISPPNHGLVGRGSLAHQQLGNGYDENCNRFPDPAGHHFMEKLNGHAIQDTMPANYCGSIFDAEAPGSRRNHEPVENGILYVTLYAGGDRDMVGGGDPSEDCQGRVMAKNLAPNAENREIPGIPANGSYPEIPGGDDKLAVHRNTVHMPEVICKALYTAVYHQAPPDELEFKTAAGTGWKSPPIVPPLRVSQWEAGVVLLFDISQSMFPGLTAVKQAVAPFLKLLSDYWGRNSNIGIAVFPALPWSCELQKDGCAQTINPMTPVTGANIANALKTVNCLSAQGNTPLLKGIETALQLFSTEKQKAIILFSDGNHNYPAPVSTADTSVQTCIRNLAEKQVNLYAIGIDAYLLPRQPKNNNNPNARRAVKSFDQTFSKVWPPAGPPEAKHPAMVDHQLLREIAENRPGDLKGKFLRAMGTVTDISAALTSIFAQLLTLEQVTDSLGIIDAGETAASLIRVNPLDRKLSILLSWQTPQRGRLGLTIKSSDGKPVSHRGEGVRVHRGETYTVITVEGPFLKQPGKVGPVPWQLEIHGLGLKEGEQESYYYSVIMDSALKMEAGFDRTAYEAGDTMIFTAAVTEAGRPATGLTEVTVTVDRPGEGVGNWYALNKISARELETIPETLGEESLSRLQRKAMYLVQHRGTVLPAFRQGAIPVELRLYDDGSHGDREKGDGIYTNQYPDTTKEGTYSFGFHASGDSFAREQNRQVVVTVKPDRRYSLLDIQWLDISTGDPVQDIYQVKLVPRDRWGNYTGPGHRVDVEIHRHGRVRESIRLEDRLDGTYTGTTSILPPGPGTGSQLVFTIDEKPFTTVEKVPRLKKWSLGIYGGVGIPGFSFSRNQGTGFGMGLHLGYRFSNQFSLVGMAGYHRFPAGSFPAGDGAGWWWNISANLESEIVKKPFRVYIDIGPGIYLGKTGDLKPGFNMGLGAAYGLRGGWDIELGVDFHHIFTSGVPDPNFYVTYTRLVYRF